MPVRDKLQLSAMFKEKLESCNMLAFILGGFCGDIRNMHTTRVPNVHSVIYVACMSTRSWFFRLVCMSSHFLGMPSCFLFFVFV